MTFISSTLNILIFIFSTRCRKTRAKFITYLLNSEKYFENLRESLRLYQIVNPPSNPPHLLNRYLLENVIY